MNRLPIIGLAALLLSSATVHADVFALIGEGNGNLGKLDITTGSVTTIKNNGAIYSGLAYNADETILYGVVKPLPTSVSSLVTITQATGATTTIGSNGVSLTTLTSLADGRLFGVDRNESLYQIDPGTGASTLVGATGLPAVSTFFSFQNSLASDGTHLYYTLASNDGNSSLYTLNVSTGTSTLIGSTGVTAIAGSAFAGPTFDAGQLYGFRTTGQTVTLNLTTGAATALNSNGHSDIFGGVGVITTVPEPASLFTLAIGVASLTLRRRRPIV